MKRIVLGTFIFLIILKLEIRSQTITDFDGNNYKTVTIGTQVWMAENLKSLHYSDGTAINGVWSYDNSDSLANIYGRLYSWESAMRGAASNNLIPSGIQGVCPADWHLPSSAEWDILINQFGGQFGGAGGKLKEAGIDHWDSPNTGATNESGFTALPGGAHYQPEGGFGVMGATGLWWTTYNDGGYVYMLAMGSETDNAIQFGTYIAPGFNYEDVSVRCLKDGGATSLNNKEVEEFFSIFPNPSTNWIIVRIKKQNITELSIYRLDGRLIRKLTTSEIETKIYTGDLEDGIYIIILRESNKIHQKKFNKTSSIK